MDYDLKKNSFPLQKIHFHSIKTFFKNALQEKIIGRDRYIAVGDEM